MLLPIQWLRLHKERRIKQQNKHHLQAKMKTIPIYTSLTISSAESIKRTASATQYAGTNIPQLITWPDRWKINQSTPSCANGQVEEVKVTRNVNVSSEIQNTNADTHNTAKTQSDEKNRRIYAQNDEECWRTIYDNEKARKEQWTDKRRIVIRPEDSNYTANEVSVPDFRNDPIRIELYAAEKHGCITLIPHLFVSEKFLQSVDLNENIDGPNENGLLTSKWPRKIWRTPRRSEPNGAVSAAQKLTIKAKNINADRWSWCIGVCLKLTRLSNTYLAYTNEWRKQFLIQLASRLPTTWRTNNRRHIPTNAPSTSRWPFWEGYILRWQQWWQT